MGKMVLTSSGFGSSVASSNRGVGSVSVAGPSSYHERRDRLARTCGYLAYLPLDGIGVKAGGSRQKTIARRAQAILLETKHHTTVFGSIVAYTGRFVDS